MSGRTRSCSAADREGRMWVARQFALAAELIEEFTGEPDEGTVNNAYVTLCVHSGIAAADVVCCARLGEYSRGEDHKAAVLLLNKVGKGLGNALARLPALKTAAGYQPSSVSRQHVITARRQSDLLMTTARGLA